MLIRKGASQPIQFTPGTYVKQVATRVRAKVPKPAEKTERFLVNGLGKALADLISHCDPTKQDCHSQRYRNNDDERYRYDQGDNED